MHNASFRQSSTKPTCYIIYQHIYYTKATIVWGTRYGLISLRSVFAKRNWLMRWNSRSSNSVADVLAKKAIYDGLRFDLNFCNLSTLPRDILDLMAVDMLGSGSSV